MLDGARAAAPGRLVAGLLAGRGPLAEQDARTLTEMIRNTSDVLWALLARAHEGRVWVPLGYGTFADWVKAEFDLSRSRAYQLLNQARVIEALTAAAPDGTPVGVSEAQARMIGPQLDEMVALVGERTAGLDPQSAADEIAAIIGQRRAAPARALPQRNVPGVRWDAGNPFDDPADDPFDGYGDDPDGNPFDDPIPDRGADPADVDTIRPGRKDHEADRAADRAARRLAQAGWDLATVLDLVGQLPAPADVAAAIPDADREELAGRVADCVNWLTALRETINPTPAR